MQITQTVTNDGDDKIVSVKMKDAADVQTQLTQGEIILPGNTTIGYLGFDNETGKAKLTFGYPYVETPRRYIRKLTLAPSVTSFVKLNAGEEKTLTWRIRQTKAASYGDFVSSMWQYSFDNMQPEPLKQQMSAEEVKAQLCNYFRESYVADFPLKYNSGLTILTNDCKPAREMQIGFCGRVLLNAFNEIEWGEAHGDNNLKQMGESIIESFKQNGFTPVGYFYDFVNFNEGMPKNVVHSIRQQSEAVYAILHYLKYERQHGRQHKDWEKKMRTLLEHRLHHYARPYRFYLDWNKGGTKPLRRHILQDLSCLQRRVRYDIKEHSLTNNPLPSYSNVVGMSLGKDNRIWLGLFGDGLYSADLSLRNVQPFTAADGSHPFANDIVSSILPYSADRLYIGADRHGLCEVNTSTRQCNIIADRYDGKLIAAALYSPATGIRMDVYTDEPGIQVYTGNFLDASFTAKHGYRYPRHSAVCLETQHYPDSPNKPQWPSTLLEPGKKYTSHCRYHFSIGK